MFVELFVLCLLFTALKTKILTKKTKHSFSDLCHIRTLFQIIIKKIKKKTKTENKLTSKLNNIQ
jgi:hypothetical protein